MLALKFLKPLFFCVFFFGSICQAEYTVFRIVSSGCEGGQVNKVQSGFSLGSNKVIITALHGVLGCRIHDALEFRNGTPIGNHNDLRIMSVDLGRDIAILSNELFDDWLEADVYLPEEFEEAYITGFPQGILSPDTKIVKFGSPTTSRLSEILRPVDSQQYQLIGSPSPSVEVWRLDGNGQIGHSGAPLVVGDVPVAVVIGGYLSGEFGTFWAVPLSSIQLAPINENELSSIGKLASQFSSPILAPISTAELRIACASELSISDPYQMNQLEYEELWEFEEIVYDNIGRVLYVDFELISASGAKLESIWVSILVEM